MSADVHHLNDGVFVGEVHIGDSTASSCVGGDTGITGHHYLTFVVTLNNEFAIFYQFFLLHRELGRNHLSECRNSLRQLSQNILYVTVEYHINHRRKIVGVFLTDSPEVGIHYRNLYLVARFLLDESYDGRSLCGCCETIFVDVIVIAHSLAGVATHKKYVAHLILLAGQWHLV